MPDLIKYVLEARSKYKGQYPKRINSVYSLKGKQGVMGVTLNDGSKHEITAKQSKGQTPKPGEEISKYIK